MGKYVSSSGGAFNQSLRSQVGGFRGDGTSFDTVTWMSMSDESGGGCGPGNCIWTFNVGSDGRAGTPDDTLVRNSSSATVTVADVPVTSRTTISSFGAAGSGIVEATKAFTPIEMVPTVIDDRLDQAMTHVTGEGLQVLRYQVQVVSGPNVNGEEGSDPYTWIICGSRAGGFGETDCDAGGGAGIIDETRDFAFVSGGAFGAGSVYDQAERFGADGRFFTADDGAGADLTKGTADDTIVVCGGGGVNAYTDTTTGSVWFGADCDSDPGADLVYGTADDGIIYYHEAIEAGFRSGARENRATSFSFLDAQSQLRQIMEQSTDDGFLATCLNCNSVGEHPGLPLIGPLSYDQIFPQVPDIAIGNYPPAFSENFIVVPAP